MEKQPNRREFLTGIGAGLITISLPEAVRANLPPGSAEITESERVEAERIEARISRIIAYVLASWQKRVVEGNTIRLLEDSVFIDDERRLFVTICVNKEAEEFIFTLPDGDVDVGPLIIPSIEERLRQLGVIE